MTSVFIGAGSNINPSFNIREAIRFLNLKSAVTGISTIYETESIGDPDSPIYYNGVIRIDTNLEPFSLKSEILRDIENQLGRVRTENKNAPRPIDLDILVYDSISIHTDKIDIPDSYILERPFLSVSLCELDPSLTFPEWGKTVCEIAQGFIDQKLKPLYDYTDMLRRMFLYGY